MLKDFRNEEYDIVIQAGQSNAEGYGIGDTDTPYMPNEQIWYLNKDFTVSRAEELVVGNDIRSNFSLSFAQEYIDKGFLKEGRKLLIVRAAVGGTGFLDNRWNMTGDLYLQMIEMVRTTLELNAKNRLVAFLWHQGENDAALKASYEVHYANLMKLLCSVREEFQVPMLPFVAGGFASQWRSLNEECCKPVVDAIHAVCDDCGHGCFVETSDLRSNYQELILVGRQIGGDTIHFSRKALSILGKRYFEAFCSCRNKV